MSYKPDSANTSSQPSSSCAIYFVHIFIAGVCTLFFINLVGSRWTYYDIGINAVTRGWTLLFFITPMIFIGLMSGATLSWSIASRYKLSRQRQFLVGIVSMMVIFVLAFLLDVWRTMDYPNPFNRNLVDFLNYYLIQWLQVLGQSV